MIKDLLTSNRAILEDENITATQKVLLFTLVMYHNYEEGYSYPSIDILKKSISSNSNDTVNKNLKSLKENGYISIGKLPKSNKNIYYIHTHLFYVDVAAPKSEPKKVQQKPVDSDGHKPVEGQIHVEEVISAEVIELSEYTKFNTEQCEKLLNTVKDKSKVINAFEYVLEQERKGKKISDKYKYTEWVIDNYNKCIVCKPVEQYQPVTKELRFNNFEARQYDYDSLEKKLLGWDTDEDNLSNDIHDYVQNY